MKLTRDLITDLEKRLIPAICNSDVDYLEKILHDDLRFLAPNGTVVTKEMDLASHRAGQMVVEQITSSMEEVRILDDVAIVIVVYDTKGKMLGNPIEGKFRYIRIWKSFEDGTKVIGGSCISL